jgi:DNA-binding MarR family transcriptional regulator
MVPDFVKDRGYLTLGSRFKRLGERLQGEVQELARSEGVEVPPGLFPTIGALDLAGSLTIGELAEALGISQPGATRNVEKLRRLGLVRSVRGTVDRRVKAVTLTDKCKALVLATKNDLWPRVEKGVAEICEGLDGPLLAILAGIERALDEKPLHVRAAKGRSDGDA